MRRSPLHTLLPVLVFIILEAISVFLVYDRGIVQRNMIKMVGDDVSAFSAEIRSGLTGFFSLRSTNLKLAEENSSLLRSNIFLREQLERYGTGTDSIAVSDDYLIIPSTVVSNTTDRQHNYIILNKGTEDGIEEGMGVVTTHGIIGYVGTASEHYSRVISLLDIDSRFGVTLKKNGTFGSLSWDGVRPEYVNVYDMPLHTEVAAGDTLISSGYSAIFPSGIPMGTISGIYLNDGINYELKVALFEDFQSLKYVYVIGLRGQREMSALMNAED